jgi:hypothetical protein
MNVSRHKARMLSAIGRRRTARGFRQPCRVRNFQPRRNGALCSKRSNNDRPPQKMPRTKAGQKDE